MLKINQKVQWVTNQYRYMEGTIVKVSGLITEFYTIKVTNNTHLPQGCIIGGVLESEVQVI